MTNMRSKCEPQPFVRADTWHAAFGDGFPLMPLPPELVVPIRDLDSTCAHDGHLDDDQG